MNDSSPQALQQLRAVVRAAADELRRQAGLADAAAQDARTAARRFSPDSSEAGAAQARLQQAQDALSQVQALHDAQVAQLATARAALLGSQPDELAQLSTDQPLVLLPVRLETRFSDAPGGVLLRIRVYPDEIFAEALEPELTQDELFLGVGYWRRPPGSAEAKGVWHTLVRKHGAPRAAWVVRQSKAFAGFTTGPPGAVPPRPDGWPPLLPWPPPLGMWGPPGLGGGFFGGGGGGDPGAPAVTPVLRKTSFNAAVTATALPDRWQARVLAGGKVLTAFSGPVREPLALTLDPRQTPDASAGPAVDPGVRWTVDFQAALDSGMALELLLDAGTQRVDQLIVFGVKASMAPEAAAGLLDHLLLQHRFTRGVGFVPQGTPTTNTSSLVSGAPHDPDGDLRWELEFGPGAVAVPDADGALAMAALGLDPAAATSMEHRELREQQDAQRMAEALWPATLGYFLRQGLAATQALLTSAQIADLREQFIGFVRGRGPLPALRVGHVPYGLLPVSSLDAWRPDAADGQSGALLQGILRALRDQVFRGQADRAPHVGRSADPDADLLEVLGQDASAREVRVRRVVGPGFRRALAGYSLLLDNEPIFDPAAAPILSDQWDGALADWTALSRLQLPGSPWVTGALFENQATLYAGGLVEDPAPAAGTPSPRDYLGWLSGPPPLPELRAGPSTEPKALLYRVARQSLLLELLGARLGAMDAAQDPAAPPPAQRLEEEIPGLHLPKKLSPWQLLDQGFGDAARSPQVAGLRAALQGLSELPPEALHRLFGETLDVCSHRLDAWITSMATRRLRALRGDGPPAQWKRGCHLGAFGWAQGLVRDSANRLTRRGGYIHAPSMDHASAAAVLRNAWLERAGGPGQPYQLSLSSRDVRAGRQFLDLLRQGLSAGEVLGFALEDALRPRGEAHLIAPLRRGFPLTQRAGEPGARTVVDGLALLQALRAGDAALWTQPGLPADPAAREALRLELLAILEQVLDPAADLLTAEAVFQTVRGNHPAASASLDALARGVRPPDPEVARAARGGTQVTHRVVVELDLRAAPDAWPAPTPRSAAQPQLDDWLAALFGDPAGVFCTVLFRGPAAGAQPGPELGRVGVSLASLGLRPLDVLALSGEDDRTGELALRAIEVARARPEVAAFSDQRAELYADTVTGADRPDPRSFADLLTLARAASAVLNGARPLTPADLRPLEAQASAPAVVGAGAATSAVQSALAAGHDLAQALRAAQPAELGPLLRKAALFGVPTAFQPASLDDDPALPSRARAALTLLDARLAQASAATLAPADAMGALFGRGYPFFPPFQLADAEEAELGRALVAGPSLVDTGRPQAQLQLSRWLRDASRVRSRLDAHRTMSLLARTLGARPADLELAQLPSGASTRWIGATLAASDKPAAGVTSVLFDRAFGGGAPVAAPPPLRAGFVVDEWSETVPHATEHTGVSFHHPDPGAEAPQAILLAVPPDRSQPRWSADLLAAILGETLELAQLRALDLEQLGDLGQLAPGTLLVSNAAGDAIGVRFAPGELQSEPPAP